MDYLCLIFLITIFLGVHSQDCSRRMPRCNIRDRRCCGCPRLFADPMSRKPTWPSSVIQKGYCRHMPCITDACKGPMVDAQCRVDIDCSSDAQFCANSKCINKLSNGLVCSENKECTSDKCIDRKCAQCEVSSDCPGNQMCDRQECSPIVEAVGFKCEMNEMCESGICIDSMCVDCAFDEDCEGGFCATPQDGKEYNYNQCTMKRSIEAICTRDQMCVSGKCIGNVCIDCINDEDCAGDQSFCGERMKGNPFKTCLDKKDFGNGCSRDQECTSNKCGEGLCGNCLNDEECGDAMYCEGFGQPGVPNDCKPKHEFGTECIRNAECTSNKCGEGLCGNCLNDEECGAAMYCEGFGQPDVVNDCKIKHSIAEICTRNAMCTSEKCGIPPGDGLGICGYCAEDRDCEEKGAFCKGLKKRNVVNECAKKIKKGGGCERSEQCTNSNSSSGGRGYCDTVCGDCIMSDHCEGGSHCRGSGSTITNECEPDVKNNNWCEEDTWCASGHCVMNLCRVCGEDAHCAEGKICSPEFKCKRLQSRGKPCYRNEECKSNNCDKGTCKGKLRNKLDI
ncbi:unnamed protein product [Owenia fusiformis]|uniref:Tenascin-X n=1 Tax=Owenia fusiformis TaxID=6347 RepID=A0A8S4P629_OWEFU|nr:unnamed protein product [Owenia fusiformis]